MTYSAGGASSYDDEPSATTPDTRDPRSRHSSHGPSLLHQSTIAAFFSLLLNVSIRVARAIEWEFSGVRAKAKLFCEAKGGSSFDSQKQRLFRAFHHLGICGVVNLPERYRGLAVMSTRVNRTGQPLPEQEQNELGCSVFRRIDLRDENRVVKHERSSGRPTPIDRRCGR